MLEGQTLEARGLDDGLAHRSYVWIPSIKAAVGCVSVFGGLHAWTADTQSGAERAAWVSKVNSMAALQPVTVVPGPMLPGSTLDASSINCTIKYLQRFEPELTQDARRKTQDAGRRELDQHHESHLSAGRPRHRVEHWRQGQQR